MLTSAGRSSRINESTALGVGSTMSIRRLWVRISNCSRLSLYLCGERMTTKTFFSVGSGTGPTTVAPARVTVSTILRAELSMTSWSYDFSRMRIFCPAIASSDSLSSYVLLLTVRWTSDPRGRVCRTLFAVRTPRREALVSQINRKPGRAGACASLGSCPRNFRRQTSTRGGGADIDLHRASSNRSIVPDPRAQDQIGRQSCARPGRLGRWRPVGPLGQESRASLRARPGRPRPNARVGHLPACEDEQDPSPRACPGPRDGRGCTGIWNGHCN